MRTLVCLSLLTACATAPATDDYPFPDGDTALGKGDAITNLPVAMDPPIAGAFTQLIDHPRTADGDTIGTFSQRYWYSTQFAKGDPNAPVLFYFCGEAPCDPAYVLTMADAAMALNASVVALEHRYYGQSIPFPDESRDHMQYLTIHDALEDAATFEAFAKTNLPLAGKWIAVGGSYAGDLAAFYREKHPELVVGAWASSAPVQIQESFSGYDTIAANALGDTCTLLFQQVLAKAGAAYDDPTQRDAFSTMIFGAPAPAAKVDFLDWFSYYAETAAQYGQQRRLCAALEQETDPSVGFAEYLNLPLVGDDSMPAAGPPAPSTPSDQPAPPVGRIIPNLLVPPTTLDNFAGNEWFYQVCSEVGFFQVHSTDRTHSIMSTLITESYWSGLCDEYVGKQPATDATRSEFVDALNRGDTTNVLFVNGTEDPWSSLSFTDSSAPAGFTTLDVATGSHCEDLEALTPDSVLGVFKAHKLFHDQARIWLQ